MLALHPGSGYITALEGRAFHRAPNFESFRLQQLQCAARKLGVPRADRPPSSPPHTHTTGSIATPHCYTQKLPHCPVCFSLLQLTSWFIQATKTALGAGEARQHFPNRASFAHRRRPARALDGSLLHQQGPRPLLPQRCWPNRTTLSGRTSEQQPPSIIHTAAPVAGCRHCHCHRDGCQHCLAVNAAAMTQAAWCGPAPKSTSCLCPQGCKPHHRTCLVTTAVRRRCTRYRRRVQHHINTALPSVATGCTAPAIIPYRQPRTKVQFTIISTYPHRHSSATERGHLIPVHRKQGQSAVRCQVQAGGCSKLEGGVIGAEHTVWQWPAALHCPVT